VEICTNDDGIILKYMDILDIKIKKEKVKEIASKSVLFSVAPEELEEFKKEVSQIPETESGINALNELMSAFENETGEVKNKMNELKSLRDKIVELENSL
jgi:hypothetical protein